MNVHCKNNPTQNMEPKEREDLVTIPASRFEQLVRAETELMVLRNAYHDSDTSFAICTTAAYVFPKKGGKADA